MEPSEVNWKFVVAKSWNSDMWAYGPPIRTLEDVYSPKVVGPTRSLRCECGRLSGPDAVDEWSSECGVFVSEDAEKTRRQRIGRVELAFPCRHPLAPDIIINRFPVAPIAYRRDSNNQCTVLGHRYEELVNANHKIASVAGEPTSAGFIEAIRTVDKGPLLQAMQNITGIVQHHRSSNDLTLDKDSLIGHLVRSLLALDSDISIPVRSLGLAISGSCAM